MAERHQPVGWYLDPQDPTSVRHWDGEAFVRFRSRPAWSLSADELVVDVDGRFGASGDWSGPVVEGPARPATERAATAAFGAAGDRPARGSMSLPTAGSPGAAHPSARPGGSLPATAMSPPWVNSRRPVLVVAIVVVVAVVAMISTVSWPTAHLDGLAPSSAFISPASQACAATFGAARSPTPAGPVALSASAAQVDGLADRLDRLADQTGNGPQVSAWLAAWHRFAGDERHEAAALTPVATGVTGAGASAAGDARPVAGASVAGADNPTGTSTGPSRAGRAPGPGIPALARAVGADATAADNFAVVNELATCTLVGGAQAR